MLCIAFYISMIACFWCFEGVFNRFSTRHFLLCLDPTQVRQTVCRFTRESLYFILLFLLSFSQFYVDFVMFFSFFILCLDSVFYSSWYVMDRIFLILFCCNLSFLVLLFSAVYFPYLLLYSFL